MLGYISQLFDRDGALLHLEGAPVLSDLSVARVSCSGSVFHLQLLELVSSAPFAAVYRATTKLHPHCTVKVCVGSRHRIEEEVGVSERCSESKHRNISQLFFAAVQPIASDPNRVFAVLCYEATLPLSLHVFLLSNCILSWSEYLFLSGQVLAAVEHVHASFCSHRDVKLQNFAFTDDGTLKLTDFGLASLSDKPSPGDVVAGSVPFMAPEMAYNVQQADSPERRVSVGQPADVWSCGIILFSLLTRRSAYPQCLVSSTSQTTDLVSRVANADWAWPRPSELQGEPNAAALRTFFASGKALVEKLLIKAPGDRPQLRDILSKVKTMTSVSTPKSLLQVVNRVALEVGGMSPQGVSPNSSSSIDVQSTSSVMEPSTKSKLSKLKDLERVLRTHLQKTLLCELSALHAYIRLCESEDIERYIITWDADNERSYHQCDHVLTLVKRLPKSYPQGWKCDRCDSGDGPWTKAVKFYHCSCGMDLCPTCRDAYKAKCTCDCGKELNSMISLRKHAASNACLKKKQAKQKVPTSFRSSKRERETTATRTSRRQSDIAVIAPEDRDWAPFNYSRPIQPQDPFQPLPPSDDELDVILHSATWVRYYHYAYDPAPLMASDASDPADPVALVYELHPGRTAAIFLRNTTELHSAVLIPFPLPLRLFAVHSLDVDGASDECSLYEFPEAASHFPEELALLRRVGTENASLLKNHRAPGTMSVYSENNSAAFLDVSDEVVYVRYVKGDSETGVVMMTLSNGATQVFGPGYELRWYNDERKFLVRADGTCAVVNDATFAHSAVIERLLHEPLVECDTE